MNRSAILPALRSACFLALAAAAAAAPTQSIRDDSFANLQLGELEDVALSSEGYLYPAFSRVEAGDTGAEVVWSAVEMGKNNILCATGHEGKLVRIGGKDGPKVLGDMEEAELTALVRLDGGAALVAAAPTGRIYRLGADDALTTFTQVEAKFVWDMELDAKGNVWAATGPEGKLYKISANGPEAKAELACDLNSANLIDIWIDRDGEFGEKGLIYAAGQNPAWLYAFKDGEKSARVIFNAAGDEIRALQITKAGLAFATNTERAPTAQILNLTLRLSGAPGGAPPGGPPPGGGGGGGEEKSMGDVFASSQKKGPASPMSAVVLLARDGFARELWTSPEMPIHSLGVTSDDHLLVAAGNKGRVFEILPPDGFALLVDTREDYIVKVSAAEGGWLLAGARNGVVYRMEEQPAKKAEYRSRVVDAGSPVKWGRFYWRGLGERGRKLDLAFRVGNTDDPEHGGWSDWTEPTTVKAGDAISLPEAPSRYLQYKAVIERGRESAGGIKADYFEAFYQQPNRAPRIKQITVGEERGGQAGGQGRPPGGGGGEPSGGARPGGGEPRPPSAPPEGGGGAQTTGGGARTPNSNAGSINVSWSADDPNGDSLVYSLFFRADDESQWKLIDDEIRANRLPLGVNGVGDGRYRFRVVARDEFNNPPGEGLQSELTSDEVVIDNTPPKIEDLKASARGKRAVLSFRAADELSFLSAIAVDLDGKDPYPIPVSDGLLDELEEEIEWTSPELPAGEHVYTVAVTDRAGNTRVDKVVFTIEP